MRKVKTFRIDLDVDKLLDSRLEHGEFGTWINDLIRDSLSTRGPSGETSGVGKTAEASLGEPDAPGETESESWRSQSTSAGDGRSAPEPGIPQHAPGTGAPTVEEPKVPLDGSTSSRELSLNTLTSPGRKPSNSSPTPTNAPKPPQSSEPSQLLTSLFSRGRC